VVSFRRFVILYARPANEANALRLAEGATQPMRAHR